MKRIKQQINTGTDKWFQTDFTLYAWLLLLESYKNQMFKKRIGMQLVGDMMLK